MTWGFVAAAAVTVVGSAVASNQARQAAKGAANAQNQAAQQAIDEQRRQLEATNTLMAPYVTAGQGALSAQQNLAGLGGEEAQAKAIEALRASPQFAALTAQGENSILANASATGGLRGGNTQGALAQFRPALLSQLIEQQYGRLGEISRLGQASAVGQAAAGQQTGVNVGNLLGQQGQAQAGQYLANGAANSMVANTATQLAGAYLGSKF